MLNLCYIKHFQFIKKIGKFYSFQFILFKLKVHLFHYISFFHFIFCAVERKYLQELKVRQVYDFHFYSFSYLLQRFEVMISDMFLIQKCSCFLFSRYYYSPERLKNKKKEVKKQGKYLFTKLSSIVEILGWLFPKVWLNLATYSLWLSDIYICWFTGGVHVFVIKKHCKYNYSSTII